MLFDQLKYVHLIGIGGIGMSALARYFKSLNKKVSGYDKTPSTLTDSMQQEGINVYFKEDISLLPNYITQDPAGKELLIIYTPAVPKDHVEMIYFQQQNTKMHKRAEVLGLISKQYPTLAVAGTHGKTTTTSLLAFSMLQAEIPFLGFIGGINENFNSNLVLHDNPTFMVTEADEYDRSFLQLKTERAIVTSMDADHLDVYGSDEKMRDSFLEFCGNVPDGKLLLNEKLKQKVDINHLSYGLSAEADYHPSNLTVVNNRFNFDFIGPDLCINDITFSMPGYHNLENATAAIAMALMAGSNPERIKIAMSNYKGVKRRFEYRINQPNLIYIDDYAHHPEEINAVVGSIKKMYPKKKITGVFQPHLFSRTRDFGDAFARSLELLDELILMPIYPAREKPIEGITSEWLLQKIRIHKKTICDKNELIDCLKSWNPELILTIGAGDIDQMVSPIEKNFKE